jgi:membrane-associated protease RseP (regulator of RpoE activity)
MSLSTLAVIAALIFMIFMHELGHYVTAKWAGMKVTEFFIGFGPKLWSFRRGETEYGVKGIPAGAYVRIIGMSNLEEVDPADEQRTYRQKSYARRMSVALAGSTMHFLMALVLMFILIVGYQFPDVFDRSWQVGAISRLETGPSPAEEAGLELGDRIVAVNGEAVGEFSELAAELRQRPGEEVSLLVERDGERLTLQTTLADRNPDGDPVGFLGVGPAPLERDYSVLGAIPETVKRTWDVGYHSVVGLAQFFSPSGLSGYMDTLTGRETTAVGGGEEVAQEGENRLLSPVGAVRIASQAADTGLAPVIWFLVLINVFVGIFNLVPLLPLDGGHVAVATYERIRSRKGRRYYADMGKLMPLTYGVVAVLVLVGVTALYLDLAQPIANPFGE